MLHRRWKREPSTMRKPKETEKKLKKKMTLQELFTEL